MAGLLSKEGQAKDKRAYRGRLKRAAASLSRESKCTSAASDTRDSLNTLNGAASHGMSASATQSQARINTLLATVSGRNLEIRTPFGRRAAIAADYADGGAFLEPVERYVRSTVLPWYCDSAVAGSAGARSRATDAQLEAATAHAAAFARAGPTFEPRFIPPGAASAVAAVAAAFGVQRRGAAGVAVASAGAAGVKRTLVLLSAADDDVAPLWRGFDCDVLVRPAPLLLRPARQQRHAL